MCESLLLSGALHRWFGEILGTALTSTLFGGVPLRFHSRSLWDAQLIRGMMGQRLGAG